MVRETFYRNLSMAKKKLKLRARFRANAVRLYDKVGFQYCPITAVAAFKRGEWYSEWDAPQAGHALGLSRGLTRAIVEAADQHDPTNGMRLTMLRRLGLKK